MNAIRLKKDIKYGQENSAVDSLVLGYMIVEFTKKLHLHTQQEGRRSAIRTILPSLCHVRDPLPSSLLVRVVKHLSPPSLYLLDKTAKPVFRHAAKCATKSDLNADMRVCRHATKAIVENVKKKSN
jgi:hypothetical protein